MPPAAPPPAPAAPPAPAFPAGAADARVDALVHRVLAADDVPAFSRVMRELMASLGREEASAQALANLVLRDYALTVKVIRAANSVHYNRTGRAVQSATHALMLLGARTVRELACGLLLFEQYRGRSPGLKELMLLSLLTANHARAAAECVRGADPETAHLCGMFRNLGEVLVAAHLPDEYAAVLRQAAERAAQRVPGSGVVAPTPSWAGHRAAAAHAVLGCAFEEVGSGVARHWGMPDVVRRAMHARCAAGDEPVATLTAFAHEFTEAVYRAAEQDASRETVAVVAAYSQRFGVTRDLCKRVADQAVNDTRELFAAAGVRLDDLRLARQVARALGDPTPADPAEPASTPATAAVDAPRPGAPSAAPATPPNAPLAVDLGSLRSQLVEELEAAAGDVESYPLSRVLLMALEGVLRGGPFDRACFFAADADAAEFRPRTGLGNGSDAVLRCAGVPFGSGAAGPALRRGEEVYLAHGARLAMCDAAMLRRWGTAGVVLFPVRADGVVIGCVSADRRAAPSAPDASTLAYVRGTVRALEHAMTSRRARAVATPPAATPAVVGPAPSPECPRDGHSAVHSARDKVDAVLRVLRGEEPCAVATDLGVTADTLAAWREAFLAGAAARLGAG